ncbi:hypothetical protein [Polaribacter uvawellassae]|uniref:hypothetical protein n=1 Tax=Polaribacter uvawellassae TaxID=3133495 RepID=UPI00321949E3
MKKIITVIVVALLAVLSVNAQEKKIKFNKGTLNICSSKNFKIEGYNGTEVIIKSLHEKRNIKISNLTYTYNSNSQLKKNRPLIGKISSNNARVYKTDSLIVSGSRNVFFARTNDSKKEGLKRLGKKQENKDLGIYFAIEEKEGELIFKDVTNGQFVMLSNESYLIKIPNSIKLNWDTSNCKKGSKTQAIFYSNKTSSLSNFNGEVELTTSLNNLKLTDVTGPVSINSIGGNVTVIFDKKLPLKLYSVYTNNGFIDITMPSNSDVNVEANAAAVYSNLDFNVLQDSESDGLQHMKLKLKRGKVKMKLEAGFGTVYLRKK